MEGAVEGSAVEDHEGTSKEAKAKQLKRARHAQWKREYRRGPHSEQIRKADRPSTACGAVLLPVRRIVITTFSISTVAADYFATSEIIGGF